MENEKVYRMSFAKIYPLLVNKAVKKGRTVDEVNAVLSWLTGYSGADKIKAVNESVNSNEFFEQAPALNPNRKLLKGLICGIRVEDIEDPLMQEIRYLDKLVDELAKGKSMEKIRRNG